MARQKKKFENINTILGRNIFTGLTDADLDDLLKKAHPTREKIILHLIHEVFTPIILNGYITSKKNKEEFSNYFFEKCKLIEKDKRIEEDDSFKRISGLLSSNLFKKAGSLMPKHKLKKFVSYYGIDLEILKPEMERVKKEAKDKKEQEYKNKTPQQRQKERRERREYLKKKREKEKKDRKSLNAYYEKEAIEENTKTAIFWFVVITLAIYLIFF